MAALSVFVAASLNPIVTLVSHKKDVERLSPGGEGEGLEGFFFFFTFRSAFLNDPDDHEECLTYFDILEDQCHFEIEQW